MNRELTYILANKIKGASHFLCVALSIAVSLSVLSGCAETKKEESKAMADIEEFGTMEDGHKVNLYTLKNANGIEIEITNYGGTITAIRTPDAEGNFDNIVLGFNDLDKYLAGTPYFGAIIGRYGNRIANAEFELAGETYELAANDGENHLHGGEQGYDKVLWTTESATENSLELSYKSMDGEEGYPGNLSITVTYTLTDDDELKIDYEATTDQATPVNLTNHSYFNLSGDPETRILDHMLRIQADSYTPVNASLIPTGEIAPVGGTAFDFTEFHEIGARIDQVEGGYDHNFVLNDVDGSMQTVATLYDPQTKRQLEVITTEPGLQFYSGNFLDGTLTGPDGASYVQYAALCLETQHYPNSPNEPDFPSTILNAGEVYQTSTTYKFSVRE